MNMDIGQFVAPGTGKIPPMATPHRPADAEARTRAGGILRHADSAVLAVLDAQGWPMASRIALQQDAAGRVWAMLSGLALHTAALRRDPRAALLIDAPPTPDARGIALARARLSLQVEAHEITAPDEDAALRAGWLDRDPKAAVYARLPDFRLWRMQIRGGMLNAGFGRAYRLEPGDLS